jgi:hypothetical protein
MKSTRGTVELTIDDHGVVFLVLLGKCRPFCTHSAHLLGRCKSYSSLYQLEHSLFGFHRQFVILVATEGFILKKFLDWTGQNIVIAAGLNTVDFWMAVKPRRSKSVISILKCCTEVHIPFLRRVIAVKETYMTVHKLLK